MTRNQHRHEHLIENSSCGCHQNFTRFENVAIGLWEDILAELQQLNEGVTHLATEEQTAKVVSNIAALKETVLAESAAIKTRIDELTAAGEQPDPALDQAAQDLTDLRNAIAGITPGGAEPDAPETPPADTPPADTPPA